VYIAPEFNPPKKPAGSEFRSSHGQADQEAQADGSLEQRTRPLHQYDMHNEQIGKAEERSVQTAASAAPI